jgi:hypothetical protein
MLDACENVKFPGIGATELAVTMNLLLVTVLRKGQAIATGSKNALTNELCRI